MAEGAFVALGVCPKTFVLVTRPELPGAPRPLAKLVSNMVSLFTRKESMIVEPSRKTI